MVSAQGDDVLRQGARQPPVKSRTPEGERLCASLSRATPRATRLLRTRRVIARIKDAP